METTYIFGHKIPDTDSVCSSIALSYLLNKTGNKTIPKVIGDTNRETEFVLKKFDVKYPEFLNDVKIRVNDMHYNENAMIYEKKSIYDAYRFMTKNNLTGLPIIDSNKKLTGYVNLKEISKYLIEGDITILDASYNNILSVLEGKKVLQFDDEIRGHVIAAGFKSETFLNSINLTENDVLIVGDRFKLQEYAVNSKVKLIILVNNFSMPEELLALARVNRVNVISTDIGTFKCANIIKLCNYIGLLNVNPNPVTFGPFDYRDDFIEQSRKYGYTNYPIVSKKGTCLGMIKLMDVYDFNKKKVILVDHNQEYQSVDGLEEADIIQIVDHHNIGVFRTSLPINFRVMPVGSTCTIIYQMFKEANVLIPYNIAGLMLSAILSDTLLLKSPTTTQLDIDVANDLARITGLVIDEYGMEMFKAASSLSGMSTEQIINNDIKVFKYQNSSLSISQIFTLDYEEIERKQIDIIRTLNSMCSVGNFKYSVLFVTDVIKNGSYVYFSLSSGYLLKQAFDLENLEQGHFFEGFVSRKKQMLPPILDVENTN